VKKAAIITGSESGIGKATAVALAKRGYDIGVTYIRDEKDARETAEEVRSAGRRAEVRRLDLARTESVQPTLEEMIGALGGLDALVNNAATGAQTPFLEIPLEEWRHVLEVDLTGAFLAAQVAARHMVSDQKAGSIVNVTSVHEHVPLANATPYVVAKHALGGLTKNMALELAEHGIRVNSVAPGEIATPMTEQEDVDPRGVDRPGIPLGRPGDAREVGELIAWLASPESSYTTGASYVIDGGMLLMGAEANRIAMA
jgi:NAD(P)-dependent dehydrogenase (short-subunit alcohol dehydrogenase family)